MNVSFKVTYRSAVKVEEHERKRSMVVASSGLHITLKYGSVEVENRS